MVLNSIVIMNLSNYIQEMFLLHKNSVSSMLENSHKLMNEIVVGTASRLKEAHVVCRLDELLKEKGVTQKQLSSMTGMRAGTISQWVNAKSGHTINLVQLMAIMVALRVTDITEIITIRLPKELEEKYKQQSAEWSSDKEMPIEVKEMFRENVLKAANLDYLN